MTNIKEILESIHNLSIQEKEEFLYNIDDIIKEIKEELLLYKDNLKLYKVNYRTNIKVKTNVEDLLNKYPIDKYKNFYRINLNTKEVLDTLSDGDIEYEVVKTEFLSKIKNNKGKE